MTTKLRLTPITPQRIAQRTGRRRAARHASSIDTRIHRYRHLSLDPSSHMVIVPHLIHDRIASIQRPLPRRRAVIPWARAAAKVHTVSFTARATQYIRDVDSHV